MLLGNTIKQRHYNRIKKNALKLKTRKSIATMRLKLTFPVISLVVMFPIDLILGYLQEKCNELKRRRAIDQKNTKSSKVISGAICYGGINYQRAELWYQVA